MLYSKTLLFIHSIYNILHLLTPNSQSTLPSPPPSPLVTSSFFMFVSLFYFSVSYQFLVILEIFCDPCEHTDRMLLLDLSFFQSSSKLENFWNIVQFSCSIMSDSLQPHELQHTRLPCPSPSHGACSDSYPLSQWCHPIILSSVVPFSCCLKSFPASGSFLMSRLFTSGGQSIRASTKVLTITREHLWGDGILFCLLAFIKVLYFHASLFLWTLGHCQSTFWSWTQGCGNSGCGWLHEQEAEEKHFTLLHTSLRKRPNSTETFSGP